VKEPTGLAALALPGLSLPPVINGSFLSCIGEKLYFVFAEQPATTAAKTTIATTPPTAMTLPTVPVSSQLQPLLGLDSLMTPPSASFGTATRLALAPILPAMQHVPTATTTLATAPTMPSTTRTSLSVALIDPVTLLEERKVSLASVHLEKEAYHVFTDGTCLYLVIKPAAPTADAQKGTEWNRSEE
jgi:hypothetical protein